MNSLLIKNAKVFNTEKRDFLLSDILIEDGLIKKIEQNLSVSSETVIEANGLYAAPGLVDIHVHMRDPGFTHKDDIFTVAECAAAGGITTLVSMPNTKPAVDSKETLDYIREKSATAKVRVLPCASVSIGLKGEELVNFEELVANGAVAFSDDGEPVANSKMISNAIEKCERLGSIVLAHCEDKSLMGKGIINKGVVSEKLGVEGIPVSCESVGVAREIAVAKALGARVHICHVSAADSIDIIRCAKAQGVRVTAETAPHYFVFTEEALLSRDADYRMNPPLRSAKDREAVIQALKDGTLDLIATDHAPHTAEEKADFEKAPNGVVGLETSFAAGLTYLVEPGHISLSDLIDLMSIRPAQIIGRPEPKLEEESAADIILFDPAEEWVVNPDKLHGKSHNTPFKGMKLKGKVKYTICDGKTVYKDEGEE
ncbi:MAG TPA: dihydroorotase [Clostridiales bacterium]|nr:dihydroorotase [Clostridiales bacterium]